MFACVCTTSAVDEEVLRRFAYSFSPLVEIAKPNTAVMNVDGCELLFGSPYQLATEIFRQSRKPQSTGGLEQATQVALAANPDASIHAATNLKGVTFVAPGEEVTCFADFAVTTLDYSLLGLDQKRANEIFET